MGKLIHKTGIAARLTAGLLAWALVLVPVEVRAAESSESVSSTDEAAGSSKGGFVSSTPELQHSGLSLEGIRDGFRGALDTLEQAGVTPMAVTEHFLGDQADGANAESADTSADEQSESGTDGETSSSESSGSGETGDGSWDLVQQAGSIGDDLTQRAEDAGDKIVDGAQEELHKTKENLLESLRKSIQDALSSLVDSLFAKL